jgi:hypothetical protein
MSDTFVNGFVLLVFMTHSFALVGLGIWLAKGLKPWSDEEVERARRKADAVPEDKD